MATKADPTVKKTQELLTKLGYPCGVPDGKWGPLSLASYNKLVASTIDPTKPFGVNRISYGMKFTPAELEQVVVMVRNLKCDPVAVQVFMGSMAWETGGTFSPSIRNKISGARGLIQFMEPTAKGLGTSQAALEKMTVSQQLEYVYKHFKPFAGRLKNDGDVYMGILLPRAVGRDDNYILWDKSNYPTAYSQNKGLDLNDDGVVTRTECLHKIRYHIVNGFTAGLVRDV